MILILSSLVNLAIIKTPLVFLDFSSPTFGVHIKMESLLLAFLTRRCT